MSNIPYNLSEMRLISVDWIKKSIESCQAIPTKNMRIEFAKDYANNTVLMYNEIFARAYHHSTSEKVIGSIPASLTDWIRFYLNRAVWKLFGKSVKYKTVSRIVTTYDSYNICPHGQADQERGCISFLAYGSVLEELSGEIRRTANELLNSASKYSTDCSTVNEYRLIGAALRYNRAAKGRF